MKTEDFSKVTPQIFALSQYCMRCDQIDPNLYTKHDVKRGLRDLNGKGVVAGLTEISEVCSSCVIDGQTVPCDGKLYYRGVDVEDIVRGYIHDDRFGFEEVVYLLLFGYLPNKDELSDFNKLLGSYRSLPTSFVRDVILKAPSPDMMNALARSVLMLYSYDENADDISIPNVLRQCLQLIALFPQLSVYGYQASSYYHDGQSLIIHAPDPNLSTAENILHMLRPDSKYTHLEAKLLDMSLVLHAEHGGGNNSSFTTHVVTSSGTDTYSAISAALGSLKGPKHGGANLKVQRMFADIMEHCSDWENKDEICEYLLKILDKQAFDHAGLIYGMGHAVYTLSDPRAVILKKFAKSLSEEKGMQKEFALYELVEREAGNLIMQKRQMFKPVCANVDFYSGFVYSMLGIPEELFTPIFAISRVSGWCSHRLEELVNAGKIIRPAYKYVGHHRPYYDINNRDCEQK